MNRKFIAGLTWAVVVALTVLIAIRYHQISSASIPPVPYREPAEPPRLNSAVGLPPSKHTVRPMTDEKGRLLHPILPRTVLPHWKAER